MKQAELRKIITQQKTLGRSPEELILLADGAGLDQAHVMPLVLEMFPGFKQTTKPQPADFKNTTAVKIWDPAGMTITQTSFNVVNDKIQKQFEAFEQEPFKIKKTNRWLILLGVIGTLLLLLIGVFLPQIFWLIMLLGDDDAQGFFVFVLPWLPWAWYQYYVKKLQQDLVKKIIADKNHWIYNPKKSVQKAQLMSEKYPLLFKKGGPKKDFEDEFWGKFHTAKQSRDFYSGIFHWTTVKKGRKKNQVEHFYQTVFAIRLQKVLSNSLLLLPENKSDRFWRKIGIGKDINVESEAFNEAFKIFKNGKQTQQELVQIFIKLSPAVQEQLVELARQNPGSSIYFAGDTFLFVRNGLLFPSKKSLITWRGMPNVKMHTNFFKKVELDSRDEAFLEERFKVLLNIASNVAKYLE